MARLAVIRGCLLLEASLVAAGALPLAANAQVYQLEPDGVVQVRLGGGAVHWENLGANGRTAPALAPAPTPQTQTLVVPAGPMTDNGKLLHQAAAQAGLHPALLEALVWQESRWRAGAVSPKGAIGLTQLMPDTARRLGVDPRDPIANLFGGARHLRSLLDRFNGDVVKALAAYNAGAKRVDDAGGVPPIRETREYVAAILSRLGRTSASR